MNILLNLKMNKKIKIFPIIILLSTGFISSCSNFSKETIFSLSELQTRREKGTLSTLIGRRVLVYGQITRVYRSRDTKQGFFTIQDGSCAMFGDFTQNIISTSLLEKGKNVYVHAIFHNFTSFNDLILSVSSSTSYVQECSTKFNINYFSDKSLESDLLRYFGCMFKIEDCDGRYQKEVMNYGSSISNITKPFFLTDLRVQLYSGCDRYDIEEFNRSTWCERIIFVDTPLLVKRFNGYILCSLINVKDMAVYWTL